MKSRRGSMINGQWQNEKQKPRFIPKCYAKWSIGFYQRWMGEKEQILSNLDYEFRTLKYFRDTIEADTMRATV